MSSGNARGGERGQNSRQILRVADGTQPTKDINSP